MFRLFLCALDVITVFIGELAAKDLDKVNKISYAEQAERQRIQNARADLADIVAVDAKPTTEEAKQERCHPVLGFDRSLRRDIVRYFLAVQDLLYGFGHGVYIAAALRCKADRSTLEALAQHAVLINAHAAYRHLGLRDHRLHTDMRAIFEEKPKANVQVRFLFKRDALTGNAALDLERHLESCPAGIELLHDLFKRGGIGKIKFTGVGRKCGVFNAASKVIHNLFLVADCIVCMKVL